LSSTAEAQCYVAKHTNEQTIANCTALIQSGRESGHNLAEDYHGRGDAYSHLKDYDRAIGDFGEALRIDPGNASIAIDRAIALDQKGDHDRAVADYNQAIQLNPKSAVAFAGRGFAYEAKKDYDVAPNSYPAAIGVWRSTLPIWAVMAAVREAEPSVERSAADRRSAA